VIQRGTHLELMRQRSGPYRKMFDQQQASEESPQDGKEVFRHESISP
jgi:hypothetical protein